MLTSKRLIITRGGLLVLALAAVLAAIPIPASLLEHGYSQAMYPALQRPLTGLSNLFPFAVMDLAMGVVVGAFLAVTARDLATLGPTRAVLRAAARLLVWLAGVYIVFAVVWGLNYRRVKLEERMPFDAAAVTADAAGRLAATTVERLNALHDEAHARRWLEAGIVDSELAVAFERASRELGASERTVLGRPKRSLLDWYFRRAGVSGMTDPIFLETLLASDLLPFERPFVIAHEWSHLAGLADEGEANLAGWLACLNSGASNQYSGWLFMYAEAIGAVRGSDRAAIASKLGPGPRDDLRAIRDRVERHINRRVASAGWRVYDSYLRANRIDAGAASYDQVVRLALGLRLPSGG